MGHSRAIQGEVIGKAMAGERVPQVAKELGVARATAYRWVQQYKSEHPDEWLEANDALRNLATIAAFEGIEQTRERNEQHKNLANYNMLRGTAIDKKQRQEQPTQGSPFIVVINH